MVLQLDAEHDLEGHLQGPRCQAPAMGRRALDILHLQPTTYDVFSSTFSPDVLPKVPPGDLRGVLTAGDDLDHKTHEHDGVVQPDGDEDDEPGPANPLVQAEDQEHDEDLDHEPGAESAVNHGHLGEGEEGERIQMPFFRSF